jgi:hypothetical protein
MALVPAVAVIPLIFSFLHDIDRYRGREAIS